MSNEYVTIQVKKEVKEKLKVAADLLNQKKQSKKITVAGLVGRLADAYENQMDSGTIIGNSDGWILDGMPIIITSDGAKHYEELKKYEPIFLAVKVSDYLRQKAMDRRFESIGNSKGEI